jgi:tRNA threonylcarbamoyladenosine biosynthesis protein TsaB
VNALAIDTATTALGLCLESAAVQRRTLILRIGLKHEEKLMPAVRALLGEAGLAPQELDLIVCSTGPGSFTGIRIGLATAKGLADGIRAGGVRAADTRAGNVRTRGGNCRLVGISTLDGLAYRYRRFPGLVAAVNPSLRKKYYAAVYSAGEREGEYLETTLADLCTTLIKRRPILITGAAAGELYELLLAEGAGAGTELIVDDSGQSTDPEGLLACGLEKLREPEIEPVPLYLRRSEAEITFFGE